MKYQTYQPHPDLASIVECYWTLEVPRNSDAQKQRGVPDGSIEMAFILGDDIKRFTNEDEFILQPRAMVLGQTVDPFYILPTGYVYTFSVRFFPYGFANLVNTDLKSLANKETPILDLFDGEAKELEAKIINAVDAIERIKIIEKFIRRKLKSKLTVDKIVKSTVDSIIDCQGVLPIKELLKNNKSKRRQLERNFSKQIGVSPKQLSKMIRLQAALKLLIKNESDSLTQIAYKSDYYDQAHFVKDFKEFTGTNPSDYLKNENLELSTLFYSED